jgi:maleylacetoacetate isomerase/maleylpyruvate isomerase
VRIALNLKKLPAEVVFVDLDADAHRSDEYRRINPQMALPALVEDDGTVLFQSVAILEYLEEKYPKPPILPADMLARAWVRGFALINVADSHPLIVPRIRNYLTDVLKVDEATKMAWIRHWLASGLEAMEQLLAEKNPSGKFCHGDSPTVADICLVTQVTPAQLFKCDLSRYPEVMRIHKACMALPAFAEAHPLKQPDAEPA